MEATMTIDGKVLTEAQSLCVRVAITAFLIQLNDKSFAESLGAQLAVNYHSRLTEVLKMITEEAEWPHMGN
jgi:hypothetical protein